MKTLVELHVLQNFAPSNLNRDDTGSPKDAVFGGVRRGRISSQCLKRAVRTSFREDRLVDDAHLALRTKRVTAALAEALAKLGHPADEAERVATVALGGIGLKIVDGKSEYLLFLGGQEVTRIATLIHQHWTALASAARPVAPQNKGKDGKKAGKEAVPAEVRKAIKDALDGGKAVDLALFGRMLADRAELNIDAAAQVAHAISTHKIDREFDFYTAVDDRQPEDTAGADMLGTVEFNSACYYRYAAIDLGTLLKNLEQDKGLALQGTAAFLRASIYAVPTGKQNSFAAHNPPSVIAFTVRQNAAPRSLANAFEHPIRPGDDGLTAASAQALAREWRNLDTVFGQEGHTTFVNATGADGIDLPGVAVATVDELIQQTIEHVRTALEG